MFDLGNTSIQGSGTSAAGRALVAPDVAGWTVLLAQATGPGTDAERIDALRQLEELKCAAEALQAEITADFDTSQRALQAAAGVPAERQSRGIAHQISLARRESPHRGQRHLGLAKILRDELPHTRAAFRAGRITEWAATVIAPRNRLPVIAGPVDRRR